MRARATGCAEPVAVGSTQKGLVSTSTFRGAGADTLPGGYCDASVPDARCRSARSRQRRQIQAYGLLHPASAGGSWRVAHAAPPPKVAEGLPQADAVAADLTAHCRRAKDRAKDRMPGEFASGARANFLALAGGVSKISSTPAGPSAVRPTPPPADPTAWGRPGG